MALILDALIEILRKPTIGDIVLELILFAAPLWAAVFVGLMVGWAWKPKWVADLVGEVKGCSVGDFSLKPAVSSYDLRTSLKVFKAQIPNCITCLFPVRILEKQAKTADLGSHLPDGIEMAVNVNDLQYLSSLVEMTDGGPSWIPMMDKLLPSMSYRAWRRDSLTGPPQYRSKTVFEDATPELVRDFFWDDEFRIKNNWDGMLMHQEPLEECPVTGTVLVHWIRKFPLFCSDREYTIGRRIWEVNGAYYCVTKGIPCPSLPRRNKPRRVDLYYSSWRIRSVESQRSDGQKTACEVLLFHYEDMGIPWEIAKIGVRQGMWGCVKRIEPGLRAYQLAVKSGATLPVSKIISSGKLNLLETITPDIEETEKKWPWGSNLPKFFMVGGAVALACTFDRGLLTKAVIFGVARRFADIGKRWQAR